jgi:hypothetical protein
MVKGKQAGLVTSYDTLSFVKVFQAVSVQGRPCSAPQGLGFRVWIF